MKIKVLGTGCAKCKKLFTEAEKAIVELEKVEQIHERPWPCMPWTTALRLDDEPPCRQSLDVHVDDDGWDPGTEGFLDVYGDEASVPGCRT